MTVEKIQRDLVANECFTSVKITPKELIKGEMSPGACARAANAVKTHGYVILEDAVPHGCLDFLYEKMEKDTKKLLVKPKWNAIGKVKGHLQPSPPRYAPYIFRELVSNSFAAQVTKEAFGDDTFIKSYSANANCPGSKPQPIHVDGDDTALIVNIGLTDVTEHNGSIELWPGTHLVRDIATRVPPSVFEARRKIAPPIRANTKKGSLLIRHTQLWHRGMPNSSGRIRHMIATMHYKYGSDLGEPLKFNKGCEAEFENPVLHPNIEFTDEVIDLTLKDSFLSVCKDTFFRLSPEAFTFAAKLYRGVLKRK